MFYVLILGIAFVVIYEVTNGFHDASDMIATAIASSAMQPKFAILLVSVFTFLGPLLGGIAVADTLGEFVRISDAPRIIGQSVAIAGVLSGIAYNLITWKLSLPSSSSMSLASGLMGAGLLALDNSHMNWGVAQLAALEITGFMKIVIGLFLSPFLGFVGGFILFRLMRFVLGRLSNRAKGALIFSQYLTVSWLAFSHGTNDGQKGMGILAMLLVASGVYHSFTVPFWVIALCAASITAGTLFGGWNLIKTVGYGVYRIKLIHSVADQIGSALVIFFASRIGAPVSTTQVIITTLMGVGASERPRHVHWHLARAIFLGWLLNIPCSMALGAMFCFILRGIL